MIRSAMVTEIRNKLGYNTGLNASLITGAIDNAQDLLEQLPEMPWFLETEIMSISTVSGEERLPVPTGFIRLTPENDMWYYDDSGTGVTWRPLRKLSLKELRQKHNLDLSNSSQTTGAPQFFALQGKYLRLYPIPDAVYTMKLACYVKDAKMDSDGAENEWATHAPYMLIGKAGMLLTGNNKDAKSHATFNELFSEATSLLVNSSEAREHSGGYYQRGGDD